jgi:hypothetical protein
MVEVDPMQKQPYEIVIAQFTGTGVCDQPLKHLLLFFGVRLIPRAKRFSYQRQILRRLNPVLNVVAEFVEANEYLRKRVAELPKLFPMFAEPQPL